MSKIAVITDSDSSLPPEIAAQFGIQQVPIRIHFDESTYTTGIDIDDRLLFEKIDQLKCLPTTSAPNPADFVKLFEKTFEEGCDEIICICVSSQVSSTFSSANSALEQLPDKKITVIDSKNLCMAQGFMTITAAQMAAAGASLENIKNAVEETCQKTHTYAVIPTLKYLALSGRVGKFVAGMADTLHIKPILSVREGKLDMVDKVRTQRRATNRMLSLFEQTITGHTIKRLAIIHVNNSHGAAEMEALFRKKFDCPEEIITAEFTPGLSVHTGSGVVGYTVQVE